MVLFVCMEGMSGQHGKDFNGDRTREPGHMKAILEIDMLFSSTLINRPFIEYEQWDSRLSAASVNFEEEKSGAGGGETLCSLAAWRIM